MLRSFAIACLISAVVVEAQFRFAPPGGGQRGASRREMPKRSGGGSARPASRGRGSGRGSSTRGRTSSRGPTRSGPSRSRSKASAKKSVPNHGISMGANGKAAGFDKSSFLSMGVGAPAAHAGGRPGWVSSPHAPTAPSAPPSHAHAAAAHGHAMMPSTMMSSTMMSSSMMSSTMMSSEAAHGHDHGHGHGHGHGYGHGPHRP